MLSFTKMFDVNSKVSGGTLLLVCVAALALGNPVRLPTERIVGGSEAVPHAYPFAVGVLIDEVTLCGGAILNNYWILTAAHCLYGSQINVVITGAHDLSVEEPEQTRYDTRLYLVHEGYDDATGRNDIGLIKLELPVNFASEYIAPIRISSGDPPAGTPTILLGWGADSMDGTGAGGVLREAVGVPVIDRDVCASVYGDIIDVSVVCTDTSEETGACVNDGGNPVVSLDGSQVLGVTSFISPLGCATGDPDGLTNVFYFADWIRYNVFS